MSAIYIHIPFCKQACYYCDFHFSTSLKKKDELLQALAKELQLRKDEFQNETVETIYFGGGTPSLLTLDEIQFLLDEIDKNYTISQNPEITLEANPDDLTAKKITELAKSPVNRLSIGVQSFFNSDLQLMNRAHNAEEALKSVKTAQNAGFENISIDLIYGIPKMSNERWLENVQQVLDLNVPHISAYALTVEPKTALEKFIKKGSIENVNDEVTQQHFFSLVKTLEINQFIHYELSNFGKEGFFSKNNTAYWTGKSYLGIGPSAHSFHNNQRSFNVANNHQYIKALDKNEIPLTTETLTETDRYNEYVMTALRTIWGINLAKIEQEFGEMYKKHILHQAKKYIDEDLLVLENVILNGSEKSQTLKTTLKGKFLTDGIAADLFLLNLK